MYDSVQGKFSDENVNVFHFENIKIVKENTGPTI